MALGRAGGELEPARSLGTHTLLAHQPCNPVPATADSPRSQLGVDAWAAVGSPALPVDDPDLVQQLAILPLAPALRAAEPGVVATRRHLEHPAQRADPVPGGVLPDEAEP